MKFLQALKKAWNNLWNGQSASRSRGGSYSRSSDSGRSYSGRSNYYGSSYYGGGSYGGSYNREQTRIAQREARRKEEEKKEKRRQTLNAFKAKTSDYKSLTDSIGSRTESVARSTAEAVSDKEDAVRSEAKKKFGGAFKAKKKEYKTIKHSVPLKKITYSERSAEKAQEMGDNRSRKDIINSRRAFDAKTKKKAELRRKEWHEATNNRFNVDEKGISKEEKAKRRQNVKMQAYDPNTAVAEAKYAMKHHKKAESIARGALSGVTFGASDVLAKYGTKGEAKKAEEVYQKNKSKGYETAGDIAGSLASFGLTSGASKTAIKKALPKTAKFAGRQGEKLAAKLASNKLIVRAAEKEAANAVNNGLIKTASKEAIERIAKSKAKELVANLAEDAAVNITTGALKDINTSVVESKNIKDFSKNMAKSAAMNLALGGAATVGLPAVGKAVKRSFGGVSEGAEVAIKDVLRNDSAKREIARRAGLTSFDAPTVRSKRTVEAATGIDIRRELSDADINNLKTARNALQEQKDFIVRNAQKSNLSAEEINRQTRELTQKINNIDRVLSRGSGVANNADEAIEATIKNVDNRTVPQNVKNTDDVIPFKADEGRPFNEIKADGDFPYAMVDESAEGIKPDTPMDTAKARLQDTAQDIAQGKDGQRAGVIDNVIEDIQPEETTKGVKIAREKFEDATGIKIDKGENAPSTKEVYDAYKDYHISQGAEGVRRKRSRAAASQINAMTSDAEKELRQRLVQNGEGDYEVIFTDELFDKITKEFKEDGPHWIDRITDGAEDINKIGAGEIPEMQARCQYLMSILDPSSSDGSEEAYTSAFKLAKDLASKSGQTLNMRRNFVKLTRAGKIESTIDDLVKMLDGSFGFEKKFKGKLPRGKYDRINFIKGVLMDDPAIEKAVTKVVDAPNEEAVSQAYTELLYAFNKQNPKSGYDVIQEIRYLNMLGNPKTHIRNIFGSGFFAPMRQVTNAIRSAIEEPIAKSVGMALETRHGGLSLTAAKEAMSKNPTTEAGKEAAEALKRRAGDLLGSAKYGTQQYTGRAKTVGGKVVDALSDFNSNLLTKEDDVFKSIAFKENYIKTYNRYLKDGKPITDKVKRMIENDAIKEANVATFNEYNGLAKALQKITKNATDANASTGARWAGRAVNAVIPFEKVPANLMKQSINYSPLGIARGMANIKTAAKQGNVALLNDAIDQLASGVTGTGIFSLGLLLGKTTDMFTTNAGKEDPSSKFKKDRGMQNYSINFKDPETGKGYSFTLDWLVPTSATFFAGVEMSNQLKSGGNGLSAFGDWATVVSRLSEPVMETSMLSGLHSMLETMRGGYGGDDELGALHILARETTQSYLNSLVPTLAGQISRTAYSSDMQVAGDGDWEYFRNSFKSKMGLANTNILGDALGADTDAYGNIKNEKNSASDYAKAALKNFLSPANIQRIDFSKVDEAKLAEYNERVKSGEDPENLAYLFPKKQYKKEFKLGDDKIKMSNRELSSYNQAKTTGGEEGMRYILENIMFNRQVVGEDGKKTPADSAYTKEQKAALMAQFKGKSMREVEEWLYVQPEFQSATDAERKKAINGLWTLSGQGKANASQRVGEQAVYKAQGKDVNEYNFKNEISEKKQNNLQQYIDAGIITYEEAVDFARNAGKTYYYENEDGGSSQTYFNKKQMIEYLVAKGYSEEKAEALFNSFKASNAKPYGSSSGRRGYRRRGYRRRGYRRRSSGSTKSVKLSVEIKPKDFKADKVEYEDMASAVSKSGNLTSSAPKIALPKAKVSKKKAKALKISTTKIAPPKVKNRKYEV